YNKLARESKRNAGELAQKAYEADVLREVGSQIGYALDATKIIQIVSGSLERLIPYSVISYIVLPVKSGEKMKFWCNVKEPVSPPYVRDIKLKMISALTMMVQDVVIESDVVDGVSGGLIDARLQDRVQSFFNLPIVVSGKLVALINISSSKANIYNDKNTEVLYRMAQQVSTAVTNLHDLLKAEKGRLDQAVESLSDGLMMVDKHFQLQLVNGRMAELLGLQPDPDLLDVLNKLQGHLDLRTVFETALKSSKPLGHMDVEVNNKTLSVLATRVINHKTNEPMGVVVTFYDETDAKSLERLRSEFMALMVHELRAPLTTIKSTVEYINEEGLATFKKDELEHHISVIHSTSQSMLELVNDLLDVAKIEAGKFDIVCQPSDIEAAIRTEIDSFEPLAVEKGLKITASFDSDVPTASFDRIRMKQVLNNLLSNAIKFTDSGGITVKVGQEVVSGNPVDIIVSVADTGIGIDKEGASRLFSRFSQLKDGRDHAGLKSSGLGLFITKGIVSAMGGKIWVDSAGPGLGSSFNFTVPIAKEKQAEVSEDDPHIVFSTKRVARA
ncbi:PAS domain-containing protein, partial [Candidatus Curtissbacteria bacterium]|nr:PAS domain-containing protein [Candidatus Curtissbacteria bacterium]